MGILDRVDRLRIGNPPNGTSVDEDDLSVEGDVSIGGNLTVAGTLSLTGNVTLLGNLEVDGTLGVDGAAALRSTLVVDGGAVFSNTAKFSGRVDMERGLISRAQASFSQGVDVSGAAVFSNTAKFSGRVELERGAFVSQGILVASSPTPLVGTVGIGNDVDVRAKATGRGTIAFPGGVNISTEAFLKVFSGTTAYWVPAFSGLYSQP